MSSGQVFGAALGGSLDFVPYDPAWPARFAKLRDQLAAALGPAALRIDHVGSTAVPGLAAKNVVDIQVVVADQSDLDAYRPAVESTGVALRLFEPQRSMFRRYPGPRDHHVHVTSAGSQRERVQLLFVDYLRAHPARRDAYATLKAELAVRFAGDRVGYGEAKTEFITQTLALAQRWAAATGWQVPPPSPAGASPEGSRSGRGGMAP